MTCTLQLHFHCFEVSIVRRAYTMASGSSSSKTNPPKPRKRVDVDPSSLKRARDGSAFTRCGGCKKDIPVAVADMHDCQRDGKIWANLEVPEKPKPAETKKPIEEKKSKAKVTEEKRKKPRREKKVKDPNRPKRPPTAFFIFMDEFRKTYKEANPDAKGGAQVAKHGGDKWKTMSDEEKKQYVDKAAEMKADYDKTLANYLEEKDGVDVEENAEQDVEDGAPGSEVEE